MIQWKIGETHRHCPRRYKLACAYNSHTIYQHCCCNSKTRKRHTAPVVFASAVPSIMPNGCSESPTKYRCKPTRSYLPSPTHTRTPARKRSYQYRPHDPHNDSGGNASPAPLLPAWQWACAAVCSATARESERERERGRERETYHHRCP